VVSLLLIPYKQKEAERRQAQSSSSAPCEVRLALCGARSPSGVPPRLLPKGLFIPKAQRQAMLPGTRPERSVRHGRPNRGAETSRCSTGITPAAPVPVQRCTSHAGHGCRQDDARSRPGAKVTSLCPREPHSPRRPMSPTGVLHGARFVEHVTAMGTNVKTKISYSVTRSPSRVGLRITGAASLS
jgi:hypothetical protein